MIGEMATGRHMYLLSNAGVDLASASGSDSELQVPTLYFRHRHGASADRKSPCHGRPWSPWHVPSTSMACTIDVHGMYHRRPWHVPSTSMACTIDVHGMYLRRPWHVLHMLNSSPCHGRGAPERLPWHGDPSTCHVRHGTCHGASRYMPCTTVVPHHSMPCTTFQSYKYYYHSGTLSSPQSTRATGKTIQHLL